MTDLRLSTLNPPPSPDRSLHKGVYVAVFVCLFSSVTNAIPLSGALIVLSPLAAIIFLKKGVLPHYVVPTYLMLIFFLVSAVLYDPNALADFGFYRRDGNVFVTYAPLVLLSLLHLKIDIEKLFRVFVAWATGMNFINLVMWLFTKRTFVDLNEIHYPFLFQAHNATGGYLALLAGFSLAIAIRTHKKRLFWSGALFINVVGLVLSDSRGSIVGLGAGTALVFMPALLRRFGLVALTVVNLAVVVAAYSVVNVDYVLDNQLFALEEVEGAVDGAVLPATDAMHRIGTVVNRVFDLWPSAWHHFLSSPLVGTGFGSFDDHPFRLAGIEGVVAWKTPDVVEHSAGHAHHSYFHILAETGVGGLALFLASTLGLYRFISRGMERTTLQLGLLISFWTAVVASFSEHRFFTPSQMLPFMILLGLAIAARPRRVQSARNHSAGLVQTARVAMNNV